MQFFGSCSFGDIKNEAQNYENINYTNIWHITVLHPTLEDKIPSLSGSRPMQAIITSYHMLIPQGYGSPTSVYAIELPN